MIVHKCDYCLKEMKGRTLELYPGCGADLEFCSSKCVIDYLKDSEEETKKTMKELERKSNYVR